MIQTLITRISKLEQYSSVKQTVLWKDVTESRWPTVYGLLKPNDNAIFIADNKLLIGNVSEIKRIRAFFVTT